MAAAATSWPTSTSASARESSFSCPGRPAPASPPCSLIGGLEPASRGSIQVNGQRLDKLPARARPYLRRAVGVILQDTHLLFDRSAFENVMLPLAVTGQAWDSAAPARRWTRSACRARKN